MSTIGWLLAVVLWVIGLVHVYWGLGGVWPARNETALARAVVGARNIQRMPSTVASLIVGAALLWFGHLALIATGAVGSSLPATLVSAGGWLLAVVFVLRGVAAYVPRWRRMTPEQPFASLDRRIYGPLCLALGLGFVVISIKGLT